MLRDIYCGSKIPSNVLERIDYYDFVECTRYDLQGFTVIGVEKKIDLCNLYGFYPIMGTEKYIITIVADEGNITMMIAMVPDE